MSQAHHVFMKYLRVHSHGMRKAKQLSRGPYAGIPIPAAQKQPQQVPRNTAPVSACCLCCKGRAGATPSMPCRPREA